jgi:hypothetical protein
MSGIAEIRAGLVATIERDLLSRFQRAAPRDRVAIEATADLAVHVALLDHRISSAGCDDRTARSFLRGTSSLVRLLHLFGPDRIAGTLAEGVVAEAAATADALLFVLPNEAMAGTA